MNTDPEVYGKKCIHARENARRAWQMFAEIIDDHVTDVKFQAVMDFGCGIGDTTADLPNWIAEINRDKRYV